MAWTEADDDRVRELCKTLDVGKLTECPKCGMGRGGSSEMMLAQFCQHRYCPFREWRDANDPDKRALADWKASGGPRPSKRPDGIPTRIDQRWMTPAERAISEAMDAVENAGASEALTDAVTRLSEARDRVADHVESTNLP